MDKASRINVPSEKDNPAPLGRDAVSKGAADQNESVSAEERTGEPRSPLSAGPRLGSKGEYLPARYKLDSGAICEDR